MNFNAPVDHGVGTEPQMVAVGDLDGDGDDDVAVPNWTSGDVTVLLATAGVLSAAPGSPIDVPSSPGFVQIADFTGDNVADIVVGSGHEVIVIHGVGDGTFLSQQSVTDISSALTPAGGGLTGGFAFSASDLNGDDDLDLVLTAANATKVSVWRGDGNGQFTSAQEFEGIVRTPVPVAFADVNGDNRPDFAVGESWSDESGAGSLVYVFIQLSDGTFDTPVPHEAYKKILALAFADLNDDTFPDLIAPAYYGHGYQAYQGDDIGRVSIFFGNGDGTFDGPIHPTTGAYNPNSLGVADFDGDGDLDIATSNHWYFGGPGRISILPGDGAGGFAAPLLYSTSVGPHPSAIAAGDFDGNKNVDLVWLSNYLVPSTPTLKVMRNANDCDFTPPEITPIVEGVGGGSGWYIGDVSVEWDVTDNESAIQSSSGCGFILISADTAATTLTCEATSGGGTSSQSVTIKRDATRPTAAATAGPPPNTSGWRKTNVTVNFTGTDALSGGVTCTPQAVISAEGASQSINGYCYDAAGNQSLAAVVSNINIDKTGPEVTISVPLSGVTYNRNQVVNVSYSCTDSLAGVASCSGPAASGQPLDTSKKANNAKFTVTSTDLAGNVTKQTVTYSVK
jgi:hypothetical protein